MATKAKAVHALKVKDDFPILKRKAHGKPLVYLDSGATSQKPKQVIKAIEDYYTRYNANVHRGVYELSEEATRAYEGARETLAKFLHAKDARELVFTRGTTESINAVAYSWGIRGPLKKGDEIDDDHGAPLEHGSLVLRPRSQGRDPEVGRHPR